MTEVVITANAENDIAQVISYIARDNPIRAKSFTKELLQSALNLISTFPLSNPIYNKALNVRLYAYQKYNLYYQYDEREDVAYILQVVNCAKQKDVIVGQ
ncbi:MAG: type II toxin-antitoxin system RelE/ParE family toxin [Psychrosphaera sp.]|nr:type II toxin-antitoxin system RelE/ParE family toxin [Psychrosphaera sp.]